VHRAARHHRNPYSRDRTGGNNLVAKTILFAPLLHWAENHPEIPKNMVQNYGAKDMLQNNAAF
jgi:hypothetical protein